MNDLTPLMIGAPILMYLVGVLWRALGGATGGRALWGGFRRGRGWDNDWDNDCDGCEDSGDWALDDLPDLDPLADTDPVAWDDFDFEP